MLAKLGLDSKEVCELRVNYTNNVYVYGSNFTGYHWDYDFDLNPSASPDYELFHVKAYPTYKTYCYNITNSKTPETVFKSSNWYFRVVFVYVFGFIIWLVGTYLMALVKGKHE
jgi:hypothetical protein